MGLVLKKFCFCIELRTGCLIIGYLRLIEDLGFFFRSFYFLVTGRTVVGDKLEVESEDDPADDSLLILAYIMNLCFMMLALLSISFCFVLLIGVYKNKPGYLKAYVIYTTICIVTSILVLITHGLGGSRTENLIVFFADTILLDIYILFVARGYYLKMDDLPNRPTVQARQTEQNP